MALSAAAIDAMVQAGASAEMIAAVVKADLAASAQAEAEASAARRAKEAERKRRQRAELREGGDVASPTKSQGLDGTARDSAGLDPPKKEGPPHPLRKNTPSSSLRSVSQPRREQFADFWLTLPRRIGSNPKQPAEEKFYRLLKGSPNPDMLAAEILDGARRFAAWAEGQDPKFIPQAITWLNQGRWKDDYALPPEGARPRAPPPVYGRPAKRNGYLALAEEDRLL